MLLIHKHLRPAKVAAIVISLLVIATAHADSPVSQPASTQPSACTEVIIVGTIHGLHFQAPTYSPEVLREIIRALKPSAILDELPLDMVEADGRPKEREYYPCAENWASDQAASELHVPQIPFDRPDRADYYARTNYFQRQDAVSEWRRKWLDTEEKRDPNGTDLACVRFAMETQKMQGCFLDRPMPEFINSDVHDRLMHLKHVEAPALRLAVFKKSADFTPEIAADMALMDQEWEQRNAVMARNIENIAARYPGGRLVVLTGAEHRYILRDLLRQKDRIVLKEYWQIVHLDLTNLPDSQQKKDWEARQQELLAQSAAVCRDYWQAISQGKWEDASSLFPACSADSIKAGLSSQLPISIVRVDDARLPQLDEGATSPLTTCIIKFGDGRTKEIRMVMGWKDGKCVIVATLGQWREVGQ